MYRTVNAIMIETGDSLITEAAREMKANGHHIEQIARHYNIYIEGANGKVIPNKLYEVLYR